MVSDVNNVKELNSDNLNNKSNVGHSLVDDVKSLAPDPQVQANKSPKRHFTKAHKLKVLTAYNACTSASERGALLRREGIYHSRISAWRQQLGMSGEGNKGKSNTKRTDHLIKENEQLKRKLAQAEAIIDLQKKVSELLGTHILPHENIGSNL
jgi:hypothetical protein